MWHAPFRLEALSSAPHALLPCACNALFLLPAEDLLYCFTAFEARRRVCICWLLPRCCLSTHIMLQGVRPKCWCRTAFQVECTGSQRSQRSE